MVYEITGLVGWYATKLINLKRILELQWFLYSMDYAREMR